MSIPGFRVSTDQPGLISSGSNGRGFRNSSTPLLLGSRDLTKIWERGILHGEEQGAACCGAGPPSKANSPHVAQTPHLFGLRRACSDLFYFFFFRVLVQNQLNLRSWRPGSAVACGALGSLPLGPVTPNLGSSSGPEFRFGYRSSELFNLMVWGGGIRPEGSRQQVSLC